MGRRQVMFASWLALVAALSFVPGTATGGSASHSVIVSEDPVDWTPHILGPEDYQVEALAQIGDRIYVGGKFKHIQEAGSTEILRRRWLFAYDAETGAIDPAFHPRIDARVNAIAVAPKGNAIFVGGEFHFINGESRDYLAKLDAATGAPVETFGTRLYDSVRDLVVRGNTLYVAGEFEKVTGEPRYGLAALDPQTGDVRPNLAIPFTDQRKGPEAVVRKIDVTPDGSKLVAIGNFTKVDGLDRTELAVLNLSTSPARVADWQTDEWKDACIPSEDYYTRDVDISPDGTYFVTVSIGYWYEETLCDTAARWELDRTGSDIHPTWVDSTGGDSLISVAVTGTAVYVGGHQRWMNNPYTTGEPGPGAVPRSGIAALDPINGLPFSWNPGRARGNGVFVQYSSSEGLFLGSDTTQLAGEYHSKFGFFPVSGGRPIPRAVAGSLPGEFYKIGYDTGVLERRFYDGRFGPPREAAPGTDWSHARGAFMLSGQLYTGWDDGKLYVRSFDGTSVGPATNLHATAFSAANAQVDPKRITGMCFQRGRLYYAERKDPNLYYRYFTPESGVVGAQEFIAADRTSGVNWGRTRGMTLANGRLYYAIDGSLYGIRFQHGQTIRRTKAPVSGPAAGDGLNWQSRGLFVSSP